MQTALEALNAALMAKAAYVSFNTWSEGEVLSDDDLRQALPADNFTDTEISYFVSRFELVAYESELIDFGLGVPLSSGFQAAVFRDKSSGQGGQPNHYHLAIRGTEPSSLNDWAADLRLGLTGVAHGQVGSLTRFIQRLRGTGTGDLALFGDNDRVDVTGHSLGGHLAQFAVWQNPALFTEGFTFNGAGIG